MGSQLGAEALKSRHETLHLRARCEPFCITELVYVSLPLCFWNSNISPCWTLCCNRRIYVITLFYAGYVYAMYYFVIATSVMIPRDDLGETSRPCLRVGRHSNLSSVDEWGAPTFSLSLCARLLWWHTHLQQLMGRGSPARLTRPRHATATPVVHEALQVCFRV
jgi:hypothetical protein